MKDYAKSQYKDMGANHVRDAYLKYFSHTVVAQEKVEYSKYKHGDKVTYKQLQAANLPFTKTSVFLFSFARRFKLAGINQRRLVVNVEGLKAKGIKSAKVLELLLLMEEKELLTLMTWDNCLIIKLNYHMLEKMEVNRGHFPKRTGKNTVKNRLKQRHKIRKLHDTFNQVFFANA